MGKKRVVRVIILELFIYGHMKRLPYLAGCASQWYSANLEQNLYKFANTNAFPPEYQGPTWLKCRF